jgi:hypothetical protein
MLWTKFCQMTEIDKGRSELEKLSFGVRLSITFES